MADSSSQKATTSISVTDNRASSLASVPDHELDAYIADLILQKSKAKEASSQREGISAYLRDEEQTGGTGIGEARVPNTNKRFLASVIRNVEGHNHALLRQQARQAEPSSSRHQNSAGKQIRSEARAREASTATPTELLRGSEDEASLPSWPANPLEHGAHGQDVSRRLGSSSGPSSERRPDISESVSDHEATSPPASHRHTDHSPRHRDRDRSARSQEGHRERSKSKLDRQESELEKKHQPSKRSRSSREEERHRSRRSDRRHRHESDADRRRTQYDDERSHRSKRRRSDKHGERVDASRAKPKEQGSERRASSSHGTNLHPTRSSKEPQSNRRASPVAEPTKKVREWDLGKESLAF